MQSMPLPTAPQPVLIYPGKRAVDGGRKAKQPPAASKLTDFADYVPALPLLKNKQKLTRNIVDFLFYREAAGCARVNSAWAKGTTKERSYLNKMVDKSGGGGFVTEAARYMQEIWKIEDIVVDALHFGDSMIGLEILDTLCCIFKHPGTSEKLEWYMVRSIREIVREQTDFDVFEEILDGMNKLHILLGAEQTKTLLDRMLYSLKDIKFSTIDRNLKTALCMDQLNQDIGKVLKRSDSSGKGMNAYLRGVEDDKLPGLVNDMPDRIMDIGIEAIRRARTAPKKMKLVKLVIAKCPKLEDRTLIQSMLRLTQQQSTAKTDSSSSIAVVS